MYSVLGFAGLHLAAKAVNGGIEEDGSFSEYVSTLVASRAFVQFWVMIGFGFAGITANYFWKWLSNRIVGSLWKYLFIDEPKRTAMTFAVYLAWALGAFSSGIVTDSTTWGALINLAVTMGFTVDVLVNRAKERDRKQWTEEERNRFKEKHHHPEVKE